MLKDYKKIVAIDYETFLINKDAPYPKPVCLSYCYASLNVKGDYVITSEGIEVGLFSIEQRLKTILSDKSTLVLAHNLTFEAIVTYNAFPELHKLLWDAFYDKRLFCTMEYQNLINNVSVKRIQNKGLANLVLNYFNVDISSTKKSTKFAWRLKYHILEDIPLDMWPKQAVEYSLDDSRWTVKLFNEYVKIDQTLLYSEHCLAGFTLNIMAQKGMLVDKAKVDILDKEMVNYLTPQYNKLIDSGYATLCKKTGKIKKKEANFRAYIEKNIPNAIKTAKGVISLKKEILEDYIAMNPNDTLINTFFEVVKRAKIYTSFIPRLKQADPILRTEYNALINSGRTSSHSTSLYPSVNIQQMPREVEGVTWDVRNCFIPPRGFKIVSIDYSGLELSSAAHQCYMTLGYSKLRDKLNSGDVPVDPHSILAATLLGMKEKRVCTYEEFKAHKKEKAYKYIREVAKVIGLGKPGGIGRDIMRVQLAERGIYPKFAVLEKSCYEENIDNLVKALRREHPNVRKKRTGFREWSLVYDEVVEFDNAMMKIYPELNEFLKDKHERFKTGKTKLAKNDWGEWEEEDCYRYNAYGVIRDNASYTELCNGYLMQSPGAVGAKRAVNWIVEKYINNLDVQPKAFIHDELLFYVRDDDKLWEHVEDLARIMCLAMQKTLSSVRIAVEASTMDYWSKAVTLEDKTYFVNKGEKTVRQVR